MTEEQQALLKLCRQHRLRIVGPADERVYPGAVFLSHSFTAKRLEPLAAAGYSVVPWGMRACVVEQPHAIRSALWDAIHADD